MAKQNSVESGWTGWIGFAAILLGLAGVFHIIAGSVALFQQDVYTITPNAVWLFDYSQWGWVHIIAGVLALLAASSLAQGHMYGRIVAVWFAVGSVIANMAFVPVAPVWSLLMITLGVLVIWAVTVHGKELKQG